MVADRERSELARILLAETIAKEGADPRKLTIHADNGSSMASKPVAFLLADLGVTKSHSRAHVSDDNPHIEAFFKTVKYQPEFPSTFANGGAGVLPRFLSLVQPAASPQLHLRS